MADVILVMGSDSDAPVAKRAVEMLERFGVDYDVTVSSAHRSPARTGRLARNAEKNGAKIIIAFAGHAAHLAGVIASHTNLPVIGVPVDSSALNGVDALYSTVQMPPGIPVATMAIGSAGAVNAAVLAVQILAINDPKLRDKLTKYAKELDKKVGRAAKTVKSKL